MAKRKVAVAVVGAVAGDGGKSYDFELSPALVGKFELRNTHLPRVHFDGHWYDFRTMDLATAERLVKMSETFLYRIPAEG